MTAVAFAILIGILGMFVTLLSPSGDSGDGLVSWVLFTLEIVIFIGIFVYAAKSFGGERKRLYRQYERLSSFEKRSVNSEIESEFKETLCGKGRFYYRHRGFLHFIDYDDLAWVYQQSSKIPLLSDAGSDTIVASSHTNSRLIIYDRSGKRTAINAGIYTPTVLSDLMDRAPGAVFGYSEERHRLAKKNFKQFMHEYLPSDI